MTHAPGDPIRVEMQKWGGRPHWEFDGVWLGTDAYGEWLGFPAGTPHSRPGASFVSSISAVTLVPPDQHWLATFHEPGIWCHLYIDVTMPATWDGDVLRAVDLDLDVVRLSDPLPESAVGAALTAGRSAGEIYIDDEDEFLEHQVAFGYPVEVISAARASADTLFADVTGGVSPYDNQAHLPWLDQLAQLRRSPR